MHYPSLSKRGVDDRFLIEVARLWLNGHPPYLSVYDVKPPGFFALLALMETVWGPTQAAVHCLTILCDAGTAYALWRLARHLGLPSAVGLFAAFAYPLLSQMLASFPAYPPLALATVSAFALATCRLPWRARIVLSGLAIGIAITIKQSSALEATPLLWMLLREPEAPGRRFGAALMFSCAAAAPLGGFAMVLAAQGAFTPFISDTIVAALRRPSVDAETSAQILLHFMALQEKILPLAALAAFGVARFRSLLPSAPAGRSEALALWLIASWVELWLQHARWLNYLGPTFAPLLLLAGACVVASVESQMAKRLALASLVAITAVGAFPFRHWQYLAPAEMSVYHEAARAISARNPQQGDRLLGLGAADTVQVNTDTGLLPPTRFLFWSHLNCDFPGAGPERLREALASAPRFLVVARTDSPSYCEDRSIWPTISAALASGYRRVAVVESLDIYERLAHD